MILKRIRSNGFYIYDGDVVSLFQAGISGAMILNPQGTLRIYEEML